MRILSFTSYDVYLKGFDHIIAKDINDFYTKILNKRFDVVVVSFDLYHSFLEIKNYIKSYVVFITDYCDVQIYKKVLEVADYCYLYSETEKLLLRLSYLQKKILNSKTSTYKIGEFLYNFTTNELYKNLKPVKLSNAEKELLKTLIKHRKKYLSKEDILMECDSIESEASIKVLISHLRKLGLDIENQKNLGYKLKE